MSANGVIEVAIIGGGLAGAALANALLKHRHINVNIFESAPEFSERGAAVGIDLNAQGAFAEIGGAVTDVVERAGGVAMDSSRMVMGAGPNALEKIFDLEPEQRGKAVHRAALLAELLKPIDETQKHTSKRVCQIEDSDSSRAVIRFEDGTQFHADAVIGADGVRGYVRTHILGKDHPATPAQRSDFWDARSLVTVEKAKEILGNDYFAEQRQYGYVGDGGFFLHDGHDDGKMVQFVVSGVSRNEIWAEDEWSKKLDREALEKNIEGWFIPSLHERVVEVMLQNPDLKAFPQTHHAIDAPTYAKGALCIMGDAAHCMTPWQGSGAAQALEDTVILEAVLGRVKNPKQIPAAFTAYDKARRARTQKIVHSSAGTGVILCGRGEDIGLDLAKIQGFLPERWNFIYKHNQAESKKAALADFEKLSGPN
ncbi:FAD/NAD(P)-binding domain-containing protein [Periconia macrospinosa]|uniref:FAD/NAD(P)-binding domain-containing protein n=1 Tax=Periconia macrospinosa TaxID=97972 RepID=A0A2V1D9X6_9PLEO|nr:FAD/NAD(P)-binding domain-containing protein [Periconia macrospinosa]